MVEPTGYSALDLIGFTDKGDYAAGSTYVKNDIVHYGGNMWKCKLDDTTGQTPAEGTYWTLWLESDTTLASMTDTQISSPADGDVLEYDATASKWKNSKDLSNLKDAYMSASDENGWKNKLFYDLETLMALNTEGTWSGNSYTYRNVTFTLNSDGSITANGTANAQASSLFWLYGTHSAAESNIYKNMILNGCPSGGASNGYSIAVQGFASSTPSGNTDYYETGSGLTISTDNYIRIYVRIQNGLTVSNKLFKPMIRLATDTDATWQSPTKTNRQLTQDSVSWSDEAQIGAVNFAPNDGTTQVDATAGLTYTVNDDKSVTVRATSETYPYTVPATSNFYMFKQQTNKVKSGIYQTRGCPEGGSASNYRLEFYDHTSSKRATCYGEKGDYMTVDASHSNTWQITVYSGYSMTGSLTFKPMLADPDYNGPYAPYAMTNKELTDLATPSGVTSSVTSTVGTIDSSTTAYKIGKVVYVSGKITLTEAVAKWGKILTIDIGQNVARHFAFFAAWDYTNGLIIPIQVGYGGNETLLKVELMQAVASGVELRFGFYGILQ